MSIKTQARAVNVTWAARCDKTLFVTDKNDSSLPTMELQEFHSRDKLWGKTKKMFSEALNNDDSTEFDWILKVRISSHNLII